MERQMAEAVGMETSDGVHAHVVMPAGRDRELLVDWLQTLASYDVEVTTAGDALSETYDLCLIHAASLDAVESTIRQRRDAASPTYLPHLLLEEDGPGTSERTGHREQVLTADAPVDESLRLPVSKAVFHRRLDTLLRIRRMSVALAAKERQHRRLMQALPEAVVLVDDGTVVYANDTAAGVFETSDAAALVGRSIESLVAPDDRETVQSVLNAARAGDGSASDDAAELTVQSVRGTDRPATVRGVVVTYDGREVVQLLVSDLTEQRAREQRLTLFGRAIETAAQGITIADARQEDEPLVYANDGFERITGYTVGDVLGRNCRFLQGPNTDEAPVTELRRGIREREPVSVELLNYRRNGTPFWNRVDVVPITDEQGATTHFLGFQQDVTERREREARLTVLNQILRHNLGNKMTVIRGLAEHIESADDPSAEAATKIRNAAEELVAISERVQEFKMLGAGPYHELESLDLARHVRETVTDLRERHSEATIQLTTPDSATIPAHPVLKTMLSSLFRRLLTVEDARCEIEVSGGDGTVDLRIVDGGGALSPTELEVLDRDVEAPYSHIEGVELWLLKWAIEWSQGTITVEKGPGESITTVRFSPVTD